MKPIEGVSDFVDFDPRPLDNVSFLASAQPTQHTNVTSFVCQLVGPATRLGNYCAGARIINNKGSV